MASLSFLKFAAATNNGFIHAHGRKATDALIKIIDAQADERLLEIGCGTGFTAIKLLVSADKKIHIDAVDALPEMVRKAKQNARFFRIRKGLSFQVSHIGEMLPYRDGSFDKIYWESVLGIQDTENFEPYLREVLRLLQPGGTCIMNETIWLPGITQQTVDELNQYNLEQLGLRNATPTPMDRDGWIQAIEKIGFVLMHDKLVADAISNATLDHPKENLFLLAQWQSRIKKYLMPHLALKNHQIKRKLRRFKNMPQVMEARFFVFQKPG